MMAGHAASRRRSRRSPPVPKLPKHRTRQVSLASICSAACQSPTPCSVRFVVLRPGTTSGSLRQALNVRCSIPQSLMPGLKAAKPKLRSRPKMLKRRSATRVAGLRGFARLRVRIPDGAGRGVRKPAGTLASSIARRFNHPHGGTVERPRRGRRRARAVGARIAARIAKA